MPNLTDAQLVLLSKASQREDHAVELPPNLRGAAAQNVIVRLLEKGMLLEVLATRQMPIWRRDEEDQARALVITPAGLEAIGLGEDAGEAPVHPCDLTLAESDPEEEPDPGRKRREARAAGPRPGSKQALVIALLSREDGASIEDLTTATGWLAHTMRAELTRLRKRGYAITKARGEDGKTSIGSRMTRSPKAKARLRDGRQFATRGSSHRCLRRGLIGMEKVSTHRPFSRNWSNAASSQIKASPPAPPVRKPADANARIEALAGMELDGLQAEWRKLYRSQPPQRTSRHLLLLALAWKIQETAQGGSGKAVRKRLAKIARRLSQDGDVGASPSIRLKPGAQLVREWRGETYTVHVLDEGFEWQGRRYSSLSVIAREITGTRWSGPRFFGLKPSKAASLKEACNA